MEETRTGCRAVTAHGTVHADHADDAVIATHTPIVDPRYLSVRCRPHRSYALAAELDGPVPKDMYLSVEEPVRSLRPAQIDARDYLVVAGEGHPVADETDTRACLEALESWTRANIPVGRVDHRWAAHDQLPNDHLPFIGPLTSGGRRWATGFQKWGLTTAALAAAVIAEGIVDDEPGGPSIFDPTRVRSTLTPRLAAER